jgi:hypothetical protein
LPHQDHMKLSKIDEMSARISVAKGALLPTQNPIERFH